MVKMINDCKRKENKLKKYWALCAIILFTLLCCTACLGDNPKGYVRTHLPDDKIAGQASFPVGWQVIEEDGWIYIRDEQNENMLVEYERGRYYIHSYQGSSNIIDELEHNPYFLEEPQHEKYITGYSLGSNAFTISVVINGETYNTYGVHFYGSAITGYRVNFVGVSDKVTEEVIKNIAYSYTGYTGVSNQNNSTLGSSVLNLNKGNIL